MIKSPFSYSQNRTLCVHLLQLCIHELTKKRVIFWRPITWPHGRFLRTVIFRLKKCVVSSVRFAKWFTRHDSHTLLLYVLERVYQVYARCITPGIYLVRPILAGPAGNKALVCRCVMLFVLLLYFWVLALLLVERDKRRDVPPSCYSPRKTHGFFFFLLGCGILHQFSPRLCLVTIRNKKQLRYFIAGRPGGGMPVALVLEFGSHRGDIYIYICKKKKQTNTYSTAESAPSQRG